MSKYFQCFDIVFNVGRLKDLTQELLQMRSVCSVFLHVQLCFNRTDSAGSGKVQVEILQGELPELWVQQLLTYIKHYFIQHSVPQTY